jgi:uncharacterized protein
VLERWRGATSQRDAPNDPVVNERPAPRPLAPIDPRPMSAAEPRPLSPIDAPMLQPSLGLDPDRFSLLKKPLR